MARRGRFRSLANRYIFVAVLLVTFATLLLGGTVSAGVLSMARAEELARHGAYAEVVQREVVGTLQASHRVIDALSDRDVFKSEDRGAIRRALSTALFGNAEYLTRILVVEATGTIVAAYPGDRQPSAEEVGAILADLAVDDAPEFLWKQLPDAAEHSLWTSVPLGGQGGRLLVAEARTEFLAEALSSVPLTDDSAAVLLVDAESGAMLAGLGNTAVYVGRLTTYEADEDDAVRGTVAMQSRSGARYVGAYRQIPGLAQLDWRVLVTTSEQQAVGVTWQALQSALWAWALAVVLALAVTVGSFAWLVRPLRDLELRARAVAAGADVGAIEVTRHDEVGRLLHSFNTLSSRMRQLRDVSRLLASTSDRETVIDGIAGALRHMLDRRDAAIWLLDEGGQSAELVRALGGSSSAVGTRISVVESPVLTAALESGEPHVRALAEVRSDPLVRPHATSSRKTQVAVAPLVKGEARLGALLLASSGENALDDDDLELLGSFAAQATIALDNARLFEGERRSRLQAQALRRVAEIMTRPEDLRASLDEVAGIEAELLGLGEPRVLLGDPRSLGVEESTEQAQESACVATWATGAAREPGELVPELVRLEDLTDGRAACLSNLGRSRAFITPLIHGEGLAGLLVLTAEQGAPPMTERQLVVARAIATEVGLALESARLYEQARSRADNLETIFRISQAVSSSLQSRVVLNRVLDVVQKIFSADAVLLMIHEQRRGLMTVPMARGLLDPKMIEMEFAPGQDVPGRVFESRKPMRLEQLPAFDTPLIAAAREQGLASAILVPLLARGRSIGVLCVFSRAQAAFSTEDLGLLHTFAVQAALAIDNADMYSREHHVASVLQRSIMPTQLPSIDGLEASSAYVPSGGEADIGGDYFDMFGAPDGRVVLVIGDVCGSGVEAATKTSMIRFSVRGMAAAGFGPAEILRELNRVVADGGDPTEILTVWIGFLHTGTGRLCWADGGHPPALLLRAGRGRIDRLGTTGALLGAVRTATYEERETSMGAGSTLLLYTDGVTEARRGTRFFGEGRVSRALKLGGTAQEVTDRLLAAVERFSCGELHDDIAVLTVSIVKIPGESSGSADA